MSVRARSVDERRRSSEQVLGDDLIVRTRFLPPRLRPSLLERPRLDALLARVEELPLLLLRAEAGYGKTTAIASYLSRRERRFFWYGLGSSDADPMVFLLHLIHLFRELDTGIGERALQWLGRKEEATRLWAPAVDALANDLLDALPRDEKAVLVLDDYCMVNRPEINLLVERFYRAGAAAVASGRDRPQYTQLASSRPLAGFR